LQVRVFEEEIPLKKKVENSFLVFDLIRQYLRNFTRIEKKQEELADSLSTE